MMRLTSKIVLIILLPLSTVSCVQTEELYAVRPSYNESKTSWPDDVDKTKRDYDDRPRVILSSETVKSSFKAFLSNECGTSSGIRRTNEDAGENRDTATDTTTWIARNHRSNDCSLRVAAYAADQCRWMAINQNKASTTASLATGAGFIAGALVTDGLAVAHPTGDKTSAAALATAVTASGAGMKNFIPPLATVSPKDMIQAAPIVAEAVGLDDVGSFEKDTDGKGVPSEDGIKKLARVHDEVLSMCAANAIGIRMASGTPRPSR
jgi:hypothetical protein